MTYGWAILIIAIVLGAIFELGFFNTANLAPKVAAGSCQVYRPQGPGTTSFINTEGVCNNEFPQYVAQFNGAGNTYINLGTPASLEGLQVPVTITGWFYQKSLSGGDGDQPIYAAYQVASANQLWSMVRIDSGTLKYYASTSSGSFQGPGSFKPSLNSWHFFTVVISGSISSPAITIYLDGSSQSLGISTLSSTPNLNVPIYIGGDASSSSERFNGLISGVQIYNTSLSANEVTVLYDEGIGGDPLLINNLVGWWPLNGNANDYSGNLNNGVPISMVFTSSWTSGYTAP